MKEWVMRESKGNTWLEELVVERGLNLNFDYDTQLHDPFLMKDMDKAVERILTAISRCEKVMIFADYDADGVPGAAALATFFKKIGFINFIVYLPDRHIEDYGLSTAAIDQAKAQGVTLLITIDCGIANAKEIAYATNLGIETIVTDHHLVPAQMPEAIAVVDPKREDCSYPYKHLCGAGVVFKLIQAITKARNNFSSVLGIVSEEPRKDVSGRSEPPAGWEKWLLDLIAIATVSDMVPLTGENRALVHYGLKVLRKSPRPGVVELCRVLRLKQECITEDDIAFSFGPRINAASRMAHASEAFELLTTEDAARATAIANHLESLNKDRRKCVEEILDRVETDSNFSQVLGNASQPEHFLGSSETILRTRENVPAVSLIVVGHESWSLGVLGLTASRLVEKYSRPVFIWSKNASGVIKGSCRSDGSVNVVELMRGVGEDFFLNVGGHHHAGGFSLAAEKVAELESRLLGALKNLDKQVVEEKLLIDAELSPEEVTSSFYRKLEQLSPFGIENPKPVFLFRQVQIVEVKEFGNGKAHLELAIAKPDGRRLKAISFFNTFKNLNLAPGQTLDLAASVEQSFFGNYPSLRLRIVDLRRAG